MEQGKNLTILYSITLKLVLIAMIYIFMVVGKPILLPLAISILFSFLLLPISQKLEKWKVPRPIAIVLSIIVAIALVAGLVYFFYTQVMLFVSDWPELSKQISGKIDTLYQFIHEKFNFTKFEQRNWVNERIASSGATAGKYAMGVFTATGSFIASVALLPIFIFFITYYRPKFVYFIQLVFKDDRAGEAISIVKEISRVSQKYLKGLMLDVLILSVLNSTGFLIFGLEHAILFGVLLALLNIIPYVGVLIGSILPITMALITQDQLSVVLGVAGVCVFVQFLDNNFITPNVVGSSVSINPFASILALTVSALVWGMVGMIIALPFFGMMKVAFDNIEPLKPYGYLIGEEKNYKRNEILVRRIFSLRSRFTRQMEGSTKKESKGGDGAED